MTETRFEFWTFGIWICFEFRISCFGFSWLRGPELHGRHKVMGLAWYYSTTPHVEPSIPNSIH